MFAVHNHAHKNCVLMSSSCTGAKISAKTPLRQAVYKMQIRTNPQCLMLVIATFNSLFFKAIPCKSVQYWVPMCKLHVQATCFVLRELLACFCFGCGRAVLGPSVEYPRYQNQKKIIHRGLLQPRSQVLFTVDNIKEDLWMRLKQLRLRKHTVVRWH